MEKKSMRGKETSRRFYYVDMPEGGGVLTRSNIFSGNQCDLSSAAFIKLTLKRALLFPAVIRLRPLQNFSLFFSGFV